MNDRHRLRCALHARSRHHVRGNLDNAGLADCADIHNRLAAGLE